MTGNTISYAGSAIESLNRYQPPTLEQGLLRISTMQELEQYLPLVRQIFWQATRRVIHGESVPAAEKLVSLFEPPPASSGRTGVTPIMATKFVSPVAPPT
jgi:IS5 family transposase